MAISYWYSEYTNPMFNFRKMIHSNIDPHFVQLQNLALGNKVLNKDIYIVY